MKRFFTFILLLSLGCGRDYEVPNHFPGVVKVFNNKTFAAYGEGGLIITDISTQRILSHISPPREMRSIDDFDIDGNLLFIIDARNKGYLASYSIADISNPKLIDNPTPVQSGPFNGVSAKSGNLVVSGGTTFLEYFQYSNTGELSGSISFGRDRGHPDVLLSDNGLTAFISTDFNGQVDESRFGILSLALSTELSIPTVISQHGIPESGFTKGGTSPVGFPIQLNLYRENLLVAHGGGLTIVKVIENAGFGEIRLFDFGIEAIAVETSNDMAYMIGYDSDQPILLKLDISDIDNPTVSETIPLDIGDNIPTSIALSDQLIFISAGEAGILKMSK